MPCGTCDVCNSNGTPNRFMCNWRQHVLQVSSCGHAVNVHLCLYADAIASAGLFDNMESLYTHLWTQMCSDLVQSVVRTECARLLRPYAQDKWFVRVCTSRTTVEQVSHAIGVAHAAHAGRRRRCNDDTPTPTHGCRVHKCHKHIVSVVVYTTHTSCTHQ